MCLQPTEAAALTARYKATEESVWNFDELKDALLTLSHRKCAYCECELQTEATYMEVEHFIAKSLDADLVVDWNNLLPSCKRCNGRKSDHDVRSEPIVNPFHDNPADHLTLKWFRVVKKNAKGQTTIDVIDLNDVERLVNKRFEIGNQLAESIDSALHRAEEYQQATSVRRRNKLLGQVRRILLECQPSASYAATAATVLHSSDSYRDLKAILQACDVWNEELQILHDLSSTIVL
ncbi:hypothetical protein BLA13014_00531 [Burkholderia aenigmatica]|uniref:HNH nuclease domain-containing protein n=1 Tax=Burkholderia aenigmatica TaxID=2015348 RepID=A0A6P2HIH4_9BURK|nr:MULTISPECIES: HNH endonuclease [Burkholderia]VWB17499.1 hypothetical protein BLA13014_00531 [Burkholderia aenigmatica]